MDNVKKLKKEVWAINATGTGGLDATTDVAMGIDENDAPAIRIGENVFDGSLPSDLPEYTEEDAGKVLAVNEDGTGTEWIEGGSGGSDVIWVEMEGHLNGSTFPITSSHTPTEVKTLLAAKKIVCVHYSFTVFDPEPIVGSCQFYSMDIFTPESRLLGTVAAGMVHIMTESGIFVRPLIAGDYTTDTWVYGSAA